MDGIAQAISKPLSSLSFGAKITVIGALFGIPIALLIAVLFLQVNADATFYRSERVGVAYTKALRPLFADLEAYRIASAAQKPKLTGRIDADFAAALAFDAGGGKALALTGELSALAPKWRKRAPVDGILADVSALLGSISDNSKITLDPILDGYYVGDTMVNKLPSLIDGIAQAAVLGDAAVRSGRLSTDDRISVAELSGQITTARDGVEHNLPIATGAAPYLTFAKATRAPEKAGATAFAAWLDTALLKVPEPRGRPAELAAVRAKAIDAAFALYDDSIAAMDDVLSHRLAALSARSFAVFGTVFGVVLLAGVLMFALARSMSRQLAHVSTAISAIVSQDIANLTTMLKRLAAGDLTGRLTSARPQLPVSGSDEIGVLLAAYNALARSLIEMSAEYTMATDELHGLVSSAALTSRALLTQSAQASAAAEQSATAVCEIAAAVDLVADGAQDQSAKVADTATAVEELARTAEQIALVAGEQAASIAASLSALAGLDEGISALAQEGDTLRQSARDASSEAGAGTTAVSQTAARMRSLKDESLAATAAVSALEARSTQVGAIVDTIEDIADQTNLLALNAAIEAARAGDAGRGFAVVADEVRKLADRSRTATKDISQILDAMRRDTHLAANTMRASAASMDSGLAIAERAALSLETVTAAVATTTTVAEGLALRAQQMRDASLNVTDNMSSTSAAVEENAAAASEMRSTTDHVTNVIVPIAATAAANARTAHTAAAATQQLAAEIAEVDSAARSLTQRAEELRLLLERFTVDESIHVRRYLRYRVSLDLTYSPADGAATSGRTRDIGGGGLCFESAYPLAAGDRVTVRFALPGASAIAESCTIAASRLDPVTGAYAHHAAFTRIAAATSDTITNYILQARRNILTAPNPNQEHASVSVAA